MPFLHIGADYSRYIAYQKSVCIYDITYFFVTKFLQRGDRTIDQMLQAARSGKQNIAEGISDAATSIEMGIKLVNVAKGSLKELREDYQDYLRTRHLQQWDANDERAIATRDVCRRHSDTAFYQHRIDERSDQAIANIAITLICQADYLLMQLLKKMQENFLKEGGIKEQMLRARLNARNKK